MTVLLIFCVKANVFCDQRYKQTAMLQTSFHGFFIIFSGITESSRLTGERIYQNRKNILLNLPLPTHGSALLFWEALWIAAVMCNETENIRQRLSDRQWNPFIKLSSAVIAWTYCFINTTQTCWNPKEDRDPSPFKTQRSLNKKALWCMFRM